MPLKSTLFDYQRDYARQLAQHFFGLLAMDPGTGKTVTVLTAIYHLMGESMSGTVVITMPKSVHSNFANEIRKHYGNTYPVNSISQQSQPIRSNCINLIPFSIIHTIATKEEDLIDIFIVDEAHFCRNPRTRLSKSVIRIASMSTYTWLLTGTPIVNREKDLKTLYNFKPEHQCQVFSAHKEDVLDLPPVEYTKVQFTNNLVTRYNSSHVLSRITQERMASANNMSKWDFISDIHFKNEPTIVFTSYRSTALELMAFIGTDLGINGDMSASERDAAIAKFQKDGGTIVCTYAAAGVGINLTRAVNVVCMDPPWNAANLNQAVDRAHRIGQVNKLNVYILQQPNENWIYGLVGFKQTISVTVLNDKERLSLEEEMNSTRTETDSSDSEAETADPVAEECEGTAADEADAQE